MKNKYDVIIGNIPDARDPKDPDTNWSRSTANVVLTRPQACNAGKKTRPICVPDIIDLNVAHCEQKRKMLQ